MVIRNGHAVDPSTGLDELADIQINGKQISRIYVHGKGERFQETEHPGEQIIDAKGMYVLPGFIDLHVHLRDPGLTYKEDIETGTKAAAAGGVTTICAMPNTKPVVDSVETLQYVLKKANEEGYVHVKQLSSITKGMEGRELVDMEAMLLAGAVAFSEDGKSVMDVQLYRQAMQEAARLGALIMAHCEDKNLVGKGVLNEGIASEKYGVPGIPNSVEDIITARDIFLANEAGARLHLCHCSTAGTVELMRMAKHMGAKVSAEVCPHHFTLTDEDITEANSNYKMNPPLRTKKDVETLIEGLADGTMQAISTDHAPHSDEEKAAYFDKSPFGIVGLETSAALTYTALVDTGIMSIMDMATKMSYNPAKILGIDDTYGKLSEGAMADIVIFDPNETWTVDSSKFYSKGHNTPYEGYTLKGKVITTIVDGELRYNKTSNMEEEK
ncbi:MAG: dihydroorotase [Eubacteriales bacterium]|nr:dihydroorotase [Eubacteriales bacterium]